MPLGRVKILWEIDENLKKKAISLLKGFIKRYLFSEKVSKKK